MRRIATSEDLLSILPGGYEMLQTFGDDEEATVRALDRAADEQLRSAGGGQGGDAMARFELATRTFVQGEGEKLLEVLVALDKVKGEHLMASFAVDVLLLSPRLFKESKDDRDLRSVSNTFLRRLGEQRKRLTRLVRLRFWLLDGADSDGRTYSTADISELLTILSPAQLPSDIDAVAAESPFFTLGGRVAWFPRARILDGLSQRFALCVFDDSEHLPDEEGYQIPYSLVAGECEEYVGEIRSTLKKSGEDIIRPSAPPPFSADDSVATSLDRVHKQVEDLKPPLPDVEREIDENTSKAQGELSDALVQRVQACTDESEGHLCMAQAFLEVLRSGSSELTRGDEIARGGPRTLEEAFSEAIEFFESLRGDSDESASDSASLGRLLHEQRAFILAKQEEIRVLENRLAAGDDDVAVRIKVLQDSITEMEARVQETDSRHQEAIERETDRRADLEDPDTRETLRQRLDADIEKGIEDARERVDEAAAAIEEARMAVANAEEEMHHMVTNILLRLAGFVLSVVAITLVATLAITSLLGLSLVWGGLAVLFGGPIAVTLLNLWIVISIVGLLSYALLQLRKYVELRRKLNDLRLQLANKKSVLVSRLRAYWEAYSQRYYGLCNWIRHKHVFDTFRVLENRIDGELSSLRAYVTSLRQMLDVAPDEVKKLSLEGTACELLVVDRMGRDVVDRVDRAWIDDFIGQASDSFDRAARAYFNSADRKRSHYVAAGVDRLMEDLRNACEEAVKERLPTNVVGAVQKFDFDLPGAASVVPCFLPHGLSVTQDSSFVLIGPDDAALTELARDWSPRPLVVPAGDVERLLILRIVSNLDIDQVPALDV